MSRSVRSHPRKILEEIARRAGGIQKDVPIFFPCARFWLADHSFQINYVTPPSQPYGECVFFHKGDGDIGCLEDWQCVELEALKNVWSIDEAIEVILKHLREHNPIFDGEW